MSKKSLPLAASVKPSEKAILIATAAIMGFAVIFREWSDILAVPFVLLIILDVLALTGIVDAVVYTLGMAFFRLRS